MTREENFSSNITASTSINNEDFLMQIMIMEIFATNISMQEKIFSLILNSDPKM